MSASPSPEHPCVLLVLERLQIELFAAAGMQPDRLQIPIATCCSRPSVGPRHCAQRRSDGGPFPSPSPDVTVGVTDVTAGTVTSVTARAGVEGVSSPPPSKKRDKRDKRDTIDLSGVFSPPSGVTNLSSSATLRPAGSGVPDLSRLSRLSRSMAGGAEAEGSGPKRPQNRPAHTP